jgi:hypothetical protein
LEFDGGGGSEGTSGNFAVAGDDSEQSGIFVGLLTLIPRYFISSLLIPIIAAGPFFFICSVLRYWQFSALGTKKRGPNNGSHEEEIVHVERG